MAGKIVKMKQGKLGITKNLDKPMNGKIKVYESDFSGKDNDNKPNYSNRVMLCSPQTLEIIGFWD